MDRALFLIVSVGLIWHLIIQTWGHKHLKVGAIEQSDVPFLLKLGTFLVILAIIYTAAQGWTDDGGTSPVPGIQQNVDGTSWP